MNQLVRFSVGLCTIALSSYVFAATEAATIFAPTLAKSSIIVATNSTEAAKEASTSGPNESDSFNRATLQEMKVSPAQPSTSTNTTTTNVSAVGAAPSKVSVGYVSENSVEGDEANAHGNDTFMSQNNVNVSYKLSEGRTIQARQYYLYNMADIHGGLGAKTWQTGDFALQYSDETQKLGEIPLSTKARFYLPVSQMRQDVGMYELRLYGAVTQAAGKYVNIEYSINPRFYGYSINSNGQEALRVMPGISFSYANDSALVVPYTSLSNFDSWGNTGMGLSTSVWSPGKYTTRPVNIDYTLWDMGTKLNLSKNVSLEMYYEEGYNDQASNIFGNPDHSWSSYNLNLSASM